MKKRLTMALVFFASLAIFAAIAAAAGPAYKNGTFRGKALGMNDKEVTVTVTVKGGKITAVKVADGHGQTPGISDPAIAKVPAAIVAKNSPDVDVVAGATVTSNAIINATKKALGIKVE
jgi:fumarate reductase flavoprotein subunit